MARKKRRDLSVFFDSIPQAFSLGIRGQPGTVFRLRNDLNEEVDGGKIAMLKKLLLCLPQVKAKARQMKKERQLLGIHYSRPESGYPAVNGFYFRDNNEIAG